MSLPAYLCSRLHTPNLTPSPFIHTVSKVLFGKERFLAKLPWRRQLRASGSDSGDSGPQQAQSTHTPGSCSMPHWIATQQRRPEVAPFSAHCTGHRDSRMGTTGKLARHNSQVSTPDLPSPRGVGGVSHPGNPFPLPCVPSLVEVNRLP